MHSPATTASRISRQIGYAEQICKEKGLRFTSLRKRVLELVWASCGPSKAYDLLNRLGANEEWFPKPPTLYRALDFLLANGFIHKIHSMNAYVGCSHPREAHECHFLICTKCGSLEECCSEQIAKILASTARKQEFILRNSTVEIEGECRDCARAGT